MTIQQAIANRPEIAAAYRAWLLAGASQNFIKGIEQHSVRQGLSGIEWLMQENAEAMKLLARKLNLDL